MIGEASVGADPTPGLLPLPGPAASRPCATLSMLTYYRTSRSLHFPFLGSLFPFWSPTGDLVCRLEPTST
jgi:hypothetical protein